MSVTFPPGPNVGDTVTSPISGSVWAWDGVKWVYAPPSSGGPEGDDNYFEVMTLGATWTASGLTQVIGSFTVPAGDWDLLGTIGANVRFADLQWLELTGTVNGVAIPQLAPFLQGGLVMASATVFQLPLSTFRVNSPDAPADIEFSLTLSYFNPIINPNAWMFVSGRNWAAESFGNYLEYAPEPVTWVNPGDSNSLGIMALPDGDWDVTGIIFSNCNGGDLQYVLTACWPNSQANPMPGFGGGASGTPLVSSAGQYNQALSTFRATGPINLDIRTQIQYANTTDVTGQLWLRARQWS